MAFTDLQQRLDKATILRPEPGADYLIEQTILLRDGQRIINDPERPATFHRAGNCVRLFAFNGLHCRIANPVINVNLANEWRPFNCAFALDWPDNEHRTEPARPTGDCVVSNGRAYSANGFKERSTKDSWIVSYAHNRPKPVDGFLVQNFRSTVPTWQLTGNGSGVGLANLTLRSCSAASSRANAIGFSSLGGGQFVNVLVEQCSFWDCYSVGMFFGQDGDGPNNFGGNVILRNCHFEFCGDGPQFVHGVYIRPGHGDRPESCAVDAAIRNNTFDFRRCRPDQIVSFAGMVAKYPGNRFQLTANQVASNSPVQGTADRRLVTVTQARNFNTTTGQAILI